VKTTHIMENKKIIVDIEGIGKFVVTGNASLTEIIDLSERPKHAWAEIERRPQFELDIHGNVREMPKICVDSVGPYIGSKLPCSE